MTAIWRSISPCRPIFQRELPATDNALPHGSRWVPVAELLESWRRNPLPETEMQALSEFDTFRHEQHPARFRMMPATGWWIASSPTPNATCDPASWVDSVTGRFQQI